MRSMPGRFFNHTRLGYIALLVAAFAVLFTWIEAGAIKQPNLYHGPEWVWTVAYVGGAIWAVDAVVATTIRFLRGRDSAASG
jgi:hypothetical protein